MSKVIFGLDIGTRSVTGILIEQVDHSFHVIDYYMKEHKERSMRDGQIHDVIAVADIIKDVKEALEERNKIILNDVCVAAAGRTLKTVEASSSVNLHEFPIQTTQDVKHLELSALQAAQEKLANGQMKDNYSNYYCVGYSLLYYKLDNERIGSLIEQNGQEASVDIIATFLPKVVVESLLTAINLAELKMEAMTLEPIAALHILIPESMRRLNVVLVDIGAGTSDIAITNQGTVIAYGMVPVAGDEITEAISDHYLLDFPEAEKVKRQIVNDGKAEIEDILGFTDQITKEQLLIDINAQIEHLADKVAEEILTLNTKAPRAVMLVGGGSLTPRITDTLATKLDLPANRVAVRGVDAITNIHGTDKLPSGPEFVTPIGIAITAKERPVQYVNVTVNDRNIRLFELNELTVGDCLVQAGLEINRMYGKPGLAKFIKINDKEITVPGEFGKEPDIYLNEKKVTVDHVINNGDQIRIEKGNDGIPASLSLAELIDAQKQIKVYMNESAYTMGNTFLVNNISKDKDYIVQDNDVIRWKRLERISDLLDFYQLNRNMIEKFPVIVNQKHLSLKTGETKILLNNEVASSTDHVKNNDRLEIVPANNPTVADLFKQLRTAYAKSITVYFNNEKVILNQPAYNVQRNEETLSLNSELRMNDRIKITEKSTSPFIYQNIFSAVEIDLTNARGNFTLYCNDQKATFDTIIQSGDRLTIIWGED